uniref:Uncharacterized protein n=1 Tax=Glossina palpalis gambiensis TaxID=67801 RepID=A0A1B0BXG5_9MUSC
DKEQLKISSQIPCVTALSLPSINCTSKYVCVHRLKKLFDLRIAQLAIALRMLETFTAETFVERYIAKDKLILIIWFAYFAFLTKLLFPPTTTAGTKNPPLDRENVHPPNHFRYFSLC